MKAGLSLPSVAASQYIFPVFCFFHGLARSNLFVCVCLGVYDLYVKVSVIERSFVSVNSSVSSRFLCRQIVAQI